MGSPQEPIRVTIADDASLIYSDDFRAGWAEGFEQIGCQVQVVDVKVLRSVGGFANSPYRSTTLRGTTKGIAQQIASWQPHLVWCHHGRACSMDGFTDYLRRYGCQSAVYLCDEPYETGETTLYSPLFDFVFTIDPCTIAAHQAARGMQDRVWYLPAAARTDHFALATYESRPTPALFLGNASLTPRPVWLDLVEREVPGAVVKFRPRVEYGHIVPVAKGHPDWVSHEDHPRLYSSCIVGLNVHRAPWITEECMRTRVSSRPASKPIAAGGKLATGPGPEGYGTGFWNDFNLPAGHINPRFFEMAACGTCVVNDNSRFELARLFPSAPRADTPERFLEIVRWFVDHPELAEQIGRECSFQISERHSYRHRAAEVLHRAGLRGASAEGPLSFLGEPTAWLTTQDFDWLKDTSPSALTGLCGSWSPPRGTVSTSTSGRVSAAS